MSPAKPAIVIGFTPTETMQKIARAVDEALRPLDAEIGEVICGLLMVILAGIATADPRTAATITDLPFGRLVAHFFGTYGVGAELKGVVQTEAKGKH